MKHSNSNNIFTNWQVKIICLFLAVLVYYAFAVGIPCERKITLPLDIILPQNMTVTSNIPQTADVVIKGSEDKIYMIDVSRIKLYADFSNVHSAGVASAAVVIDYSDLLDFIGISDLKIKTEPATVKLYFE